MCLEWEAAGVASKSRTKTSGPFLRPSLLTGDRQSQQRQPTLKRHRDHFAGNPERSDSPPSLDPKVGELQ